MAIAHQLQKGFTLVELLIVVIILAILAAIVVPQFAASTDDAKISSLDTTLANMRAAIDLYYQQHGEYPSAITAAGGTACAVPADGTGAGAADTRALHFWISWHDYTNEDGAACTQKYGTKFHIWSLSQEKLDLPDNPITGVNTLEL